MNGGNKGMRLKIKRNLERKVETKLINLFALNKLKFNPFYFISIFSSLIVANGFSQRYFLIG